MLTRWLEALPLWKCALVVVAAFTLATAWAWSFGQPTSPRDDRWTPQTISPAVPTEMPRVLR